MAAKHAFIIALIGLLMLAGDVMAYTLDEIARALDYKGFIVVNGVQQPATKEEALLYYIAQYDDPNVHKDPSYYMAVEAKNDLGL